MDEGGPRQTRLHATCVALSGRGLLVLGASGSGKSALALELMAFGAELVADDQVLVTRQGDRLVAAAPPGLPALIEARGIGLLHARLHPPVELVLAVDLDRQAVGRLPPKGHIHILDTRLEVVPGPVSRHFGAAIRHYILMGRGE